MASGEFAVGANGYLRVLTQWSSTSNGPVANTSTLTVNVYASRSSSTTKGRDWYVWLVVGGETVLYTHPMPSVTAIGTSWVHMGAWTGTVSNNSDGSCSRYIIGKIQGPDGTSLAGVAATSEGTAYLDTIQRGTYAEYNSAYVNQNTVITANKETELTIKSYVDGWSYKAYATINNKRVDITNSLTETNTTGVVQKLTLDGTLLTDTETSAFGVLTLENYSNGEYVYSTNQDFKLQLQDSPTIETVSCAVYNKNEFLKDKNIYVQGKSCANIVVVANPTVGANLITYTTKYNNKDNYAESTVNNFYTNIPFSNAGENIIFTTVTDSRKLVSEEKQNKITVLPYTEPRLTSVIIKRGSYNNSDWYDSVDGEDVKIVCSYNFTTFGIASDNKARIQVLFNNSLLQEHSNITSGEEVFYLTNFSDQSAGTLVVQISDLVEPESWITKTTEVLPSGAVFDVNIDLPGVAVGQLATDEKAFKINSNWDLVHSGNRYSRTLVTDIGAGYVRFARIKVIKEYLNAPIVYRIMIKNHTEPFELILNYKSTNSIDPELLSFSYKGDSEYDFYIKKTETSTWELFIKKYDEFDSPITIIDFQYDVSMKTKCKIQQLSEFVSAIPTDSTKASLIATVIRNGKSGIWDYRVWSDGTKECWGVGSQYVVTLTSSGYVWLNPYGIYFPFVYNDYPVIQVATTDQQNWDHFICRVAYSTSAINSLLVSNIGGAGVTVSGYPRFYVIGK